MVKLSKLNWRFLFLNFWWSSIIGLLLPRAPIWGLMSAFLLSGFMVVLLFLLLFEETRKSIRKFVHDIFSSNTFQPMLGSAVATAVLIKYFAIKTFPPSFLEFSILAVALVWGWLEIAPRLGIKLQPPFSAVYSAAIVLTVSCAGIVIGWGIHEVLDGQTLITLISVCCGGIVANFIPNPDS